MTYNQRDIVLIPFPFSDLTGTKKRPALVLSKTDVQEKTNHVICMMITSVQSSTSLDVVIKDWKTAGLLKPSIARTNKVFTIDEFQVLKKLGTIKKEDFQSVLDLFLKLFEDAKIMQITTSWHEKVEEGENGN